MEAEERIIALETKIAYLEYFIDELNQAVLDQNKTIKQLLTETAELKKRINDEKKNDLPEKEKPPHY